MPIEDEMKRLRARISLLEDNVVDLWHDSNAGHGTLAECLGFTEAEYAEWIANPAQPLPPLSEDSV
jgi:hypothetical protein